MQTNQFRAHILTISGITSSRSKFPSPNHPRTRYQTTRKTFYNLEPHWNYSNYVILNLLTWSHPSFPQKPQWRLLPTFSISRPLPLLTHTSASPSASIPRHSISRLTNYLFNGNNLICWPHCTWIIKPTFKKFLPFCFRSSLLFFF